MENIENDFQTAPIICGCILASVEELVFLYVVYLLYGKLNGFNVIICMLIVNPSRGAP